MFKLSKEMKKRIENTYQDVLMGTDEEDALAFKKMLLSVENLPDMQFDYTYKRQRTNILLKWILEPNAYDEVDIGLKYHVRYKGKLHTGIVTDEELIDAEELDEVLARTYLEFIMDGIDSDLAMAE